MKMHGLVLLCAAAAMCAMCATGAADAAYGSDDASPPNTPATSPGDPPSPDPDAAFQSQLEAIDRRIAQIKDLTARFEQRRYAVMLRQPIVSSGTVRVSGSRMRWDTMQPSVSTMVVDEDLLQIHYPDQKVLEIYPIEDRLAQLASSPLPRMRALQEHFTITRDEAHPELDAAHISLRLTPREAELLEHIGSIRLAVDPAGGFVLRMEITDADDERTVLLLTKHEINTGITEEHLTLTVPDDTRRVRPLGDRGNTTTDGVRDAPADISTPRE